jgi:hypothetical protein
MLMLTIDRVQQKTVPPYIVHSPSMVSINPGFLSASTLSKFSANERHRSLAVVKINLSEFTFLEHLVPICT